MNARTIQCNRTPTRRLKQHFSPTCRRLIDLSLRADMKLSLNVVHGSRFSSRVKGASTKCDLATGFNLLVFHALIYHSELDIEHV